ncbi:hypothetical protein HOY82DRAFT_607401 [Tuber indicum]|nr:hypothetical protein HOY82DRAFT_607401 [Tuber indicum]
MAIGVSDKIFTITVIHDQIAEVGGKFGMVHDQIAEVRGVVWHQLGDIYKQLNEVRKRFDGTDERLDVVNARLAHMYIFVPHSGDLLDDLENGLEEGADISTEEVKAG